jgi:pimeloyl-ACP methyl ester carboxylesterase
MPNGTSFSFTARPQQRQYLGNNSVIRFRAPISRHWTGSALALPARIAAGQASKARRTPWVSALAVPVVMLHGGKDHQVPVANVGYLRTQLAAAGKSNLFEPLVFPDYKHFIPWEHPDAVESAIRMVTNCLSRAAQNR